MVKLNPSRVVQSPVPRAELCLMTSTSRPATIAVVTVQDALVLYEFVPRGIRAVEVEREYLDQVAGGQLRPVVATAPDACLYLQSRRLVEYELARKQVRIFRLVTQFDEMPISAAWASVDDRILIAEIEDTTFYHVGRRVDVHLRVYDLRGVRAQEWGRLALGVRPQGFTWDAARGIVVFCDVHKPRICNSSFEEMPEHPLQLCLKSILPPQQSIGQIRLHPTLPIAVVMTFERRGMGGKLVYIWRIRWLEGEATVAQCIGRHDERGVWRLFSYSPSGRWLVYGVETDGQTNLYATSLEGIDQDSRSLGGVSSPVVPIWMSGPEAIVAFDGDAPWVTVWEMP